MDAPDASRGPRSRARLLAIGLAAALMAAALAALGSWQLQRLAWKQDLLARTERARSGEAHPAPGPARWALLDRQQAEYRRVEVRGRYAHDHATRVLAITALGSGYWLLTPLLTDDGWWLLVNRGFIPSARPGVAPVPIEEPAGAQRVVGLLRFSEPGGALLQSNRPDEDRWYSRDVAAIATARGLGGRDVADRAEASRLKALPREASRAAGDASAQLEPPVGAPSGAMVAIGSGAIVAPYFIDEVAPANAAARPPTAFPRPGLTVLSFSNNHLGYALTWFTLAAMVIAAAVFVLRFESRLRRGQAGDESA